MQSADGLVETKIRTIRNRWAAAGEETGRKGQFEIGIASDQR